MTLALLLAAAFVEPPFVHTAFKLWNRFVVDGQRVIMPVDGQLYEYTRAGRKLIAPGVSDVVDAFLIGNRVVPLLDPRGDNRLVPADPAIAAMIPGGAVERIISLPDHRSALVLTPAYEMFLLDFPSGATKRLGILNPHDGFRAMPSYDGGDVWYSARNGSEYFGIWRNQTLILQENHDLLQPRRQGRYLYFTAVLDSEYLLRRMDLRSGRIEQLTDHGVVYGYDFLADGTLVYFHRDLRTPGALIAGGKVLESVPSGVDFRVERLPRHAIAFQPPARTRQAGTILYIGPLHADVSPRWDPLIMGLVYQGFRVVAPNYPGSLGFGRTYEDAPRQAAVEELANWTDSLRPACTIAVSSANLLLERMPDRVPAVSLFGISNQIPQRPMLFVLGENDPFVPFASRLQELAGERVISYAGEGHWLRRREHLIDLLRHIDSFCRR